MGIIPGTTLGLTKGDTRRLDHGSSLYSNSKITACGSFPIWGDSSIDPKYAITLISGDPKRYPNFGKQPQVLQEFLKQGLVVSQCRTYS